MYYGEIVITNRFDEGIKTGEVHLYFFKEMVKIEKAKYSKVLSLIAFEGVSFDSYVDYLVQSERGEVKCFNKSVWRVNEDKTSVCNTATS
jgi:hypothetical protein